MSVQSRIADSGYSYHNLHTRHCEIAMAEKSNSAEMDLDTCNNAAMVDIEEDIQFAKEITKDLHNTGNKTKEFIMKMVDLFVSTSQHIDQSNDNLQNSCKVPSPHEEEQNPVCSDDEIQDDNVGTNSKHSTNVTTNEAPLTVCVEPVPTSSNVVEAQLVPMTICSDVKIQEDYEGSNSKHTTNVTTNEESLTTCVQPVPTSSNAVEAQLYMPDLKGMNEIRTNHEVVCFDDTIQEDYEGTNSKQTTNVLRKEELSTCVEPNADPSTSSTVVEEQLSMPVLDEIISIQNSNRKIVHQDIQQDVSFHTKDSSSEVSEGTISDDDSDFQYIFNGVPKDPPLQQNKRLDSSCCYCFFCRYYRKVEFENAFFKKCREDEKINQLKSPKMMAEDIQKRFTSNSNIGTSKEGNTLESSSGLSAENLARNTESDIQYQSRVNKALKGPRSELLRYVSEKDMSKAMDKKRKEMEESCSQKQTMETDKSKATKDHRFQLDASNSKSSSSKNIEISKAMDKTQKQMDESCSQKKTMRTDTSKGMKEPIFQVLLCKPSKAMDKNPTQMDESCSQKKTTTTDKSKAMEDLRFQLDASNSKNSSSEKIEISKTMDKKRTQMEESCSPKKTWNSESSSIKKIEISKAMDKKRKQMDESCSQKKTMKTDNSKAMKDPRIELLPCQPESSSSEKKEISKAMDKNPNQMNESCSQKITMNIFKSKAMKDPSFKLILCKSSKAMDKNPTQMDESCSQKKTTTTDMSKAMKDSRFQLLSCNSESSSSLKIKISQAVDKIQIQIGESCSPKETMKTDLNKAMKDNRFPLEGSNSASSSSDKIELSKAMDNKRKQMEESCSPKKTCKSKSSSSEKIDISKAMDKKRKQMDESCSQKKTMKTDNSKAMKDPRIQLLPCQPESSSSEKKEISKVMDKNPKQMVESCSPKETMKTDMSKVNIAEKEKSSTTEVKQEIINPNYNKYQKSDKVLELYMLKKYQLQIKHGDTEKYNSVQAKSVYIKEKKG